MPLVAFSIMPQRQHMFAALDIQCVFGTRLFLSLDGARTIPCHLHLQLNE
jgi:hypothetical protein